MPIPEILLSVPDVLSMCAALFHDQQKRATNTSCFKDEPLIDKRTTDLSHVGMKVFMLQYG